MAQDTQVTVTPDAGQLPTPPASPALNPDPADELRRENEALKKQVSDKDSFITNLNAEKSTLEARLTQVRPNPQTPVADDDIQREAARILETAQIDPEKAGIELGNLIHNTTSKAQAQILQNLTPIIEQQTYVAKIKSENQDLIELGLEPGIALRTNQLMQTGKSFKDAVDIAVKETKEKLDKVRPKSNTPVPPALPPVGAVGETGANRQPETPPTPVEESDSDEIRKAQERRRKMGL